MIKRCALILYDNSKILVGKKEDIYTSIGGRIEHNESDLNCVNREAVEETKGCINYNANKNELNNSKQIIYKGCKFYMKYCRESILLQIVEDFKQKVSTRLECNELTSLEIIDINELVYKAVMFSRLFILGFRTFVMDIGYAFFKNNDKIKSIYEISSKLIIYKNIDDIPEYVQFSNTMIPGATTYGKFEDDNIYITEQVYYNLNEFTILTYTGIKSTI